MNEPTAPGFYWRRGYNHDGEYVDRVVEVGPMISTIPNELFYWETGELGGIYVKPEPATYWQGPLVNPFSDTETNDGEHTDTPA